ncbi:MAG: flavodoxin family protein [Candidatus Paraimprobicoccus trichonymphae]|uniref:Flavodoxin family protein n=1 Tax=Candidatus Paraimprobicoccus trichonymphae TaxID=3033793 RepID=A0AA48ICQ4_9FIRM|nr:MAG: flavodoxin family protein [Candidatus Paraimprobicoccus trichonymphae]
MVLVLYSSPHSDGFTFKALNIVLKFFENSEIKIISSYDLNAKPCVDCGYCKDTSICKFYDLDEFYDLLFSSNLLIIATPVYNFSIPSPLKSIIDRNQRFYNKKFNFKEKNAILIVTSGKSDQLSLKIIKKQLFYSFKFIKIKFVFVTLTNTDKMV